MSITYDPQGSKFDLLYIIQITLKISHYYKHNFCHTLIVVFTYFIKYL